MKTINVTIALLGLLASVMALSSLIYGAFQEPFEPYLQGVMGGVLDIYYNMRDMLFSFLGRMLSWLINCASQWLTWLPPTPWLKWRAMYGDAVVILSIMLSAGTNTAKDINGMRGLYRNALGKLGRRNDSRVFNAVATVSSGFVVLLIKHMLIIAAGALCFFLLAYAENRLGF